MLQETSKIGSSNSLRFIECDVMQVTNGNIKMEELIYHLQIHSNFILTEFKRKYWIFFQKLKLQF